MKGNFYPVLDKGFVGLVDYMGDDKAIETAARTSYGEGTRTVSQTRGLIRYLMRHQHTTPFEMVQFKFCLAMPIFCARQFMRHRSGSFNEYSGRYSVMPEAAYVPQAKDIGKQSTQNKQGREHGGNLPEYSAYYQQESFCEANENSYETYKSLLEDDVPRELARNVLPVSYYTKFYWSVNLHNLFHFMKLRSDPHSQYEIRCYSNMLAGIVRQIVPLAYEAWVDYSLNSTHFSVQELGLVKDLLQKLNSLSNIGLPDSHFRTILPNERERNEFFEKIHLTKSKRIVFEDLPIPMTIEEAEKRLQNGI